MTTREQIYSALFALVSLGEGLHGKVTWGSSATFLYTSRRVKLWDDLPTQPSLCQAEHDELIIQQSKMPSKRIMTASWLIYHKAGDVASAVPATTTNQILDAVEAVFAVSEETGQPQTLGGLVQYARIEGPLFKDPGDIDGQALVVVPIKILVP